MIRRLLKRVVCIPFIAITLFSPNSSPGRVIGQDDTVPLLTLPANDPVRRAGLPIGLLRAELSNGAVQICTAAIISDQHILTASHCVPPIGNASAIFIQDFERTARTFRVAPTPIEQNKELGYAILEVEGTPSEKSGVARLLIRIPIKGESAFIIGVNPRGELQVAPNCSVLGLGDKGGPAEDAILHDCDTKPGSSGALLFSAKDLAILGLHIGTADSVNRNSALPMYLIARASETVRKIATIRPPTIDFRTVSNKTDDMALDFKRLYLALFNSLRIPVRAFEVSTFENIENVFRSKGLFFGSPFPIELDSLACDLNIDVCNRDRVRAIPEDLSSPIGHVSGYKPSRGRWRVEAPRSLFLPGIQFERQRDWVAYRKRPDQKIDDVVVAELGGCVEFDNECKNLIFAVNRNQEDKLKPEYVGNVLLPKMSFTARDVDISTALEQGDGRTLEVKSASLEHGDFLILQEGVGPTVKGLRPQPDYRILRLPGLGYKTLWDLQAVFKALGSTVSGPARIAPNSTPGSAPPRCNGNEANACELDPDDLSRYHKRLLDGLNFPYRNLSDFPNSIKNLGGGR